MSYGVQTYRVIITISFHKSFHKFQSYSIDLTDYNVEAFWKTCFLNIEHKKVVNPRGEKMFFQEDCEYYPIGDGSSPFVS